MKPALAALGLVLCLSADPALACRMNPCTLPEPGFLVDRAELLFRGRLERMFTEDGRQATAAELYHLEWGVLDFEVLDVWRGDVASRLRVKVGFQNGGNCERSYYVGEEYVLWSFDEVQEGEVPVIENCQGVGRGGWPEEASVDVETFSRGLGPPRWSAGDAGRASPAR